MINLMSDLSGLLGMDAKSRFLSLTSMNFDAKVSDVDYITASVTFKFQEMFIRDKNFTNIS